jgi:DNA polymerase III delta prime subunit
MKRTSEQVHVPYYVHEKLALRPKVQLKLSKHNKTPFVPIQLWNDKYRPLKVDEIEGNKTTIDKLLSYHKHNKLPNLLIYGKPGNGKTSTMRALARQMIQIRMDRMTKLSALGESRETKYITPPEDYILDIDASTYSGIDMIAEIESFVSKKRNGIPKSQLTTPPPPPIKLETKVPTVPTVPTKLEFVVPSMLQSVLTDAAASSKVEDCFLMIMLDEADGINRTEAQPALVDLINKINARSSSIRVQFVLVCNEPDKIIEPLKRLCVPAIYFEPIPDELIEKRLKFILKSERIINWDQSGIDTIVSIADGDVRSAINDLKTAYDYCSLSHLSDDATPSKTIIDEKTVLKVVQKEYHKDLIEILIACRDIITAERKKPADMSAGDISSTLERMRRLCEMGYSGYELVDTLSSLLLKNTLSRGTITLDPNLRLAWLKVVERYRVRVEEQPSRPLVQLQGMIVSMCNVKVN